MMEIAGVNFVVTPKNSTLRLQEPSQEVYQPFLKERYEGAGRLDFEIALEVGQTQKPTMPQIFDGQTWSLFKDNATYALLHHSVTDDPPLWRAEFQDPPTAATIYCSEQFLRDEAGTTKLLNPLIYPLNQLLLMYILAHREGAILHAAGIIVDGRGYIFPGKSGAGKSTLTRQLIGQPEIELLSDDRVVVRKIEGELQVFGTPWPGEARIAHNKSAPLGGIFFIYPGQTNQAEKITPQEAAKKLLPVTSIPWYDREPMVKLLALCEEMALGQPAFNLYFKPDWEIAAFIKAKVRS
jgi:hypothetical protein